MKFQEFLSAYNEPKGSTPKDFGILGHPVEI
jgi:hypothetical protein